MKKYIIFTCALLAVVSSGCRKDPVVPVERPEERIPINWDMKVETEKTSTKTLVGGTTEGDYISLRDACATGGTLGHAVGFWTDMTYVAADGRESHRYDVFNASGGETRLTYDGSKWVYNEGKVQYWSRGARYNFVAYYPQLMSKHVLQGSSSTSVNTFVLTYNTHNVQEDLMVAYNEVCTEDPVTKSPSIYRNYIDDEHKLTAKNAVSSTEPDNANSADAQYGFMKDTEDEVYTGKSDDVDYSKFNLDNKVPLHFRHTLAAIQVRFVFDYEDEDELLGCWFENTDDSGFHTVGTLVFGVGSRQKEYPAGGFQTLFAQKEFEHDEKEDFSWTTYQTTFRDVRMYEWKVNSDAAGIPFSNNVQAVAYTDNNLDLADNAELFAKHNGWLLILPQESSGDATLMYLLKENRNEETPVTIPKYTGTKADGTVPATEEEALAESKNPDTEYCHYVTGHRYVYTVRINKANAYASVAVEPWNYLYSSTEIVF